MGEVVFEEYPCRYDGEAEALGQALATHMAKGYTVAAVVPVRFSKVGFSVVEAFETVSVRVYYVRTDTGE